VCVCVYVCVYVSTVCVVYVACKGAHGRCKIAKADVGDGKHQYVAWACHDSGIVQGLSTQTNDENDIRQTEIVRMVRKQKTGKGKIMECHFPRPLAEYNAGMGGVDVSDRLNGGRYSVDQQFITRKWTQKVYVALFGRAGTNAYIMHRHHHAETNNHTHYDFMLSLQEDMCAFNPLDYFDRRRRMNIGDVIDRDGEIDGVHV
jgi:hypothetical protein